MNVQFFDRVAVKNIRHTEDGFLVGQAPVARTGVQVYKGSEVGRDDMAFVRVYRPEEEVFSHDAMHSYAHRPMTNDHPSDMVTADNWKDVAIGHTGDEIVRDGQTVRVSLLMMDKAAIKDFENGKRELSMGYTAVLDWESGVTEDGGLEYDAIQRDLRMNHLALVQKGRAGNTRIGDRLSPEEKPLNEKEGHSMADQLRKVIVDGLTVMTTDQGVEAIEKLQGQLTDSVAALEKAESDHAEAIAAKDAELGKKDAKIEELKQSQLSDEDLDARVTQRAALVADAKRLVDADYSGLSDQDIRSSVVQAKFGDEAVTDKSEAYIEARFDTLVEGLDAKGEQDPVRGHIAPSQQQPAQLGDADKAYVGYVDSLTNGTYHDKAGASA